MIKKILPLILSVLLICTICTVPIFSANGVKEIGTIDDLKALFKNGGSGILTTGLLVSAEDLRISANTVVNLEIGSYSLMFDKCRFAIGGTFTVTSRNESRPGEMYFTQNKELEVFHVSGRLILDHVKLGAGIIEGGGTIYSFSGGVHRDSFDGNVIGFNEYALEMAFPHYFRPEVFDEIFETGNLIKLETPKYIAEEWVDKTTHAKVTTWEDDGQDHSYQPIWKRVDSDVSVQVGSTFGSNSLWPVLTILFAGAAAVFAFLFRKEKNKKK